MGSPGSVELFIIMVIVVCLPLTSAIWAYNDAKSRGKSGLLVALFVLFIAWPLGLLGWLIFRPREMTDEA